ASATVTANVGGLGASRKTNATLNMGQTNGANDADAADQTTSNHASENEAYDHLSATIETRTHSTAVGANTNATATMNVSGDAKVTLENSARIVGNVSTSIVAEYQGVDLFVQADASCDCLGGDTNSYATLSGSTDARVNGLSGSKIKTSDL